MSEEKLDQNLKKLTEAIKNDNNEQKEACIEFIRDNLGKYLEKKEFFKLSLELIGEIIDEKALTMNHVTRILEQSYKKHSHESLVLLSKIHFDSRPGLVDISKILKLFPGVDLFGYTVGALETDSVERDNEFEINKLTEQNKKLELESKITDASLNNFFSYCRVGGDNIKKLKKMLKDNELYISKQNKKGWTGLHIATRFKNHDIINLLLTSGADPNAKTRDEMGCQSDIPKIAGDKELTPLHFACAMNDYDAVMLLLRCRANKTLLSKNRNSPMDLTDDPEIIDLLEKPIIPQ